MPASERRIVHLVLRDHPSVYTQSSGEGERRQGAYRRQRLGDSTYAPVQSTMLLSAAAALPMARLVFAPPARVGRFMRRIDREQETC